MKKLINIFAVILLLAGNTGVTTVVHYCDGIAMLSGIATGISVPDCGMDHAKYETSEYSGRGISGTDNCCSNSFLTHKVTDEYSKLEILASLQFGSEVVHPASDPGLPLKTNELFTYFSYRSPPIPGRDIRIFFSSFLI